MSIRKILFRIWVELSLLSVFVDATSFWLAENTPAPLPERPGVNYIMIFLLSAPAPFVLAFVLTVMGILLALLRLVWIGFMRVPAVARSRSRTA